MAALSMEDLEAVEKALNLTPDDLTYQQRCSRVTAYRDGKGADWEAEYKKKQEAAKPKRKIPMEQAAKEHPLNGKRLLISPLMAPNKNQNLAYEELIGHDIQVRDFNAGDAIYNADKDVDRVTGEYVIVSENTRKQIFAKTTLPKIGTEISWKLGAVDEELVPVVRGTDGQRGYIWSLPSQMVQVGDTMIQLRGLRTFIESIYPDLLPEFKDKPMMFYVDGVTLAASIPMTHALLQRRIRQEKVDAAAGIA